MCAEGFMIAEMFVPAESLFEVGKAILEAQDIRENSWDTKKKQYQISYKESAELAVNAHLTNDKNFWSRIIENWNFYFWNDVQYYAVGILKNNGITSWKGRSLKNW